MPPWEWASGRTSGESPDTHFVAFTGHLATGQKVAQACATQFKHTLIEASGNDPFIVMPSCRSKKGLPR
ncbi:MAG: aldehyde dehydrogenase family protein [Cyanobacteria bacterium P01_G01_bin.38]